MQTNVTQEVTMTEEYTLGIDLAEASFDVAIAATGSDPDQWRKFPHTHVGHAPFSEEGIQALMRWIKERSPSGKCVRVVVESTGKMSLRFARALRGRGLPEVCIINPRRSKAFGEAMDVRDKTDRIDSAILAAYGMVRKLRPVQSGTEAETQLRELTRMRKSYVEEIGSWENRLRESDQKTTRRCIEKTIQHLKQQVADLDKEIEAMVASDEAMTFQVECLKKIRCVKQVVATTLTAELGDLRCYSRTRLVGRVGLFGRLHESGTSVHKPRGAGQGWMRTSANGTLYGRDLRVEQQGGIEKVCRTSGSAGHATHGY